MYEKEASMCHNQIAPRVGHQCHHVFSIKDAMCRTSAKPHAAHQLCHAFQINDNTCPPSIGDTSSDISTLTNAT